MRPILDLLKKRAPVNWSLSPQDTVFDALQTLANQAVARQGAQLQTLADAAWRPRAVWGSGGVGAPIDTICSDVRRHTSECAAGRGEPDNVRS